jgi:hypothetical protein
MISVLSGLNTKTGTTSTGSCQNCYRLTYFYQNSNFI